MPRVVHFEIHADQPQRAIKFYQELFSWEFHKWDGPMDYWLIITGPDAQPGINGGLIARRGPLSGDCITAYVCTIGVANVDQYVERAVTLGGQIALPKMPIPGVGYLAYCKDPEGNVLGLMQYDKSVA